MNDIAASSIFITGGAQGIGLGIARAFARTGAGVALADIETNQLAAARQELTTITDNVETFELDVRDRDAFAETADAAEERLGPITVLCNNAGVGTAKPPSELTYALWDHILGINLTGTVNGIQTFVPRMLNRPGPAHIVNVASGAGLVASDKIPYVTSKFAVVGLSESLRQHRELADHGIGVTVVCPGFVRTRIMANSQSHEPAGTSGEPDPIAGARDQLFERYGLSPDIVGEQVRHAVNENSLYVHTDRMLASPIHDRTRELLAAMPIETQRDRDIAAKFETEIAAVVSNRAARTEESHT